MGIKIESKTIDREKRYVGFNIVKQHNGSNLASITVATGYYDTFDSGTQVWVSEREEILQLNNDQLNYLMSLTPKTLGLAGTGLTLYALLDTAIYAIISGKLPITYNLTIKVTDKQTKQDLQEYMLIIKNSLGTPVHNMFVYQTGGSNVTGDLPIAPTIELSKGGYEPVTIKLPDLIGDVAQSIELVPIKPPDAPTVPES